MFIVDFRSSTWTDPWFRKLPYCCKLLFIYLWSNDHKNNAGLYAIDVDTIAFETGLTPEQIKEGFSRLYPKVRYDAELELVWVVNHVKHQFMRTGTFSEKMAKNIAKALLSFNVNPFIDEFLTKYWDLQIPYPHHINTVPGYPTSGGEDTGKGVDKSEEVEPF